MVICSNKSKNTANRRVLYCQDVYSPSGQTTNREGEQPNPLTENWVKALLSMALPTRARLSFPPKPVPPFRKKEQSSYPHSSETRQKKQELQSHSQFSSVQFSSDAQSCPTFCNPMNRSMPGLPVHHQLPEFTQTNVHRVSDAIQPSHPQLSPSPPAPNLFQHQRLFQ